MRYKFQWRLKEPFTAYKRRSLPVHNLRRLPPLNRAFDLIHENGYEAVERKITHSRKAKGYIMRRSRARIERELTPEMKDASREIDQGYEARALGFGYAAIGAKTVNLLSSGQGYNFSEERIDAIKARINKLTTWESACTPFLRDIVYQINQTQHTITSLAETLGKNTGEIMGWYKEGLRVYCKIHLT